VRLCGDHGFPDGRNRRRPARELPDFKSLLPDFCCEFNSADRHRRCLESLKAQHRTDPLFYAAVVFLDFIVSILARTHADSQRHHSFCFPFPNRSMRRRISITSNDPRHSVSVHGFLKKLFGASHVLIICPIEVCPPARHVYLYLVAAPRSAHRPGVPTLPLFKLRHVPLNPSQNGRMRQFSATFASHFHQIACTQFVSEVPPDK